jgi:uncharacterized membrane protein YGL010W
MMETQTFTDPPGYWFIVAGMLLAAISAFVPHFDSAYHLDAGVLIAGFVPYLVYSVAVVLMRGMLTTVAGAALVIVHVWLVVGERFVHELDYSDGMIYYVPLLMAIIVLPLAVSALRRPWDNRVVHSVNEHETKYPG